MRLGGEHVRVGADDDGDGLLQEGEVQVSTLVCRGEVSAQPDAAPPQPDAGTPSCKGIDLTGLQLVETGSPGDLAIDGRGLFVLRKPAAGGGLRLYSREGSFRVDAELYLVDAAGWRLQGFAPGSQLLSDLRVLPSVLPRAETSVVQLALNLDANSQRARPFLPENPAATSNFWVPVEVFDALGHAHQITLYFARTADAWHWRATVDGREISGGTPGVPFEAGGGLLTFNTDGALADDSALATRWSFVGATPEQVVRFDFGTSIAEGGSGLDRTTGFGSASAVILLQQDGYPEASLSTMTVDEQGFVSALYSNAQRRGVGRLTLALFPGSQNLVCAGDDRWASTSENGEPLFAGAGEAGRGSVVIGARGR